jgi:hypothetical protein
MIDRLEAAWRSARHAAGLLADGVASVSPGWLLAGAVLHVLHQVVRTRAWFNIIRAAYPWAAELRARDVTAAYLAGAGLNSVVPARGGDIAKLYLVRRRVKEMRWSTLVATFLPETLFETAVGIALVAWLLIEGFLPIPPATSELPAVDVSLLLQHPIVSTAALAGGATALVLAARVLRRRLAGVAARLRQGLAILERPADFARHVVTWQLLGRLIRLGSLACLLTAFALPATPTTVLLVMAAQGGGRIVPLAPVSAGLRIAVLAYGFVEVTGQPVDIAQLTAFSFGAGATLGLTGVVIAVAILGRELGTASPRRLVRTMRLQLARSNAG